MERIIINEVKLIILCWNNSLEWDDQDDGIVGVFLESDTEHINEAADKYMKRNPTHKLSRQQWHTGEYYV